MHFASHSLLLSTVLLAYAAQSCPAQEPQGPSLDHFYTSDTAYRIGANLVLGEWNRSGLIHNGPAGWAAAVSVKTGQWAALRFPADTAERKFIPIMGGGITDEGLIAYDLNDELAVFVPKLGKWCKVAVDPRRNPQQRLLVSDDFIICDLDDELLGINSTKGEWIKVKVDPQRDPAKHQLMSHGSCATLLTPEAVYFFSSQASQWTVQELPPPTEDGPSE